MNEEIEVRVWERWFTKNGRIKSLQISGKFGMKPTDVGHFAYRGGKLKRIDRYRDCPRPLFDAMFKCAQNEFAYWKNKINNPQI